ncbi:group III truncated hemoglobin [Lujinxingia sediminis]|uniref:Group III truncated hemoglobin n=1 Tax=Lujinxingia sediminis TaxID=2480984 RepID=A0ABY0CXE7_9DELT|nr:group III truncated hemoglobin [Lujinxingia sediminis]RVU48541.1 group III truncated hemoglobin [Lujinxingia sediminis]
MQRVVTPKVEERRERFSIAAINEMVHTFYACIREDPVLGPIFESRIDHWPDHLERMVYFWRAVLRSEPTFTMSERGAPPVLHWAMDEVERHHYRRWLALFKDVVEGIYQPDDAEQVFEAASRIAEAFSRYLPSDSVEGGR